MAIQWGDFAGWVQAVGSLLALGFAAAAVVATRRTHRIESERDRVSAQARDAQAAFVRRAQAALVSAWWGANSDGTWGAYVRNASETPIYQVYLTVVDADDGSDDYKSHYLLVPPGEVSFCEIGTANASAARRVKLSFTDAAGARWQRNQYGQLAELQPTLRVTAESRRATVLSGFADDFRAAYGVTVEFRTDAPSHSQREFVADFEEMSGTDAVECPHDWLGDLIARKLIEPTVLAPDHREAFPDWALATLTVDGRLYGLPTTMDTVALFRNTGLVSHPPATFDEVIALGLALRDAGRVREVFTVRVGEGGDPFQIWPLFTGAGGWLFGRNGHGWNPARIGLDTPESTAAFGRLRELGEGGTGMLRTSIGRTEAIEAFATGQSPFLLSSSDALQRVRECGTPVAIGPVPPFAGGHRADAFTLVHGLAMARNGSNKIIAHDLFADYLTHQHVMSAVSDGIDAPVVLRTSTNDDPHLRQFRTLCEAGTPMPSFAEMEATWRILGAAEIAVITGASAEVTAKRAAAQVTALFAAEKGGPNG
jgi:maltose-binding protein MalE